MAFASNLGTLGPSSKSDFLNPHLFTSLPPFHFQYSCGNVLKLSSKPRRVSQLTVRSEQLPQNSDFPKYYSKKEKKPFPVPIVDLRRAARERLKKSKGAQKARPSSQEWLARQVLNTSRL